MKETSIFVTTQFEDQHCRPEAPEEVAFLRNMHRHMFHVTLTTPVDHDDRELEFFIVKKWLNETCAKIKDVLKENKSCEMMANYIATQFLNEYKKTMVEVMVSEDGENGAIVKLSGLVYKG